MASDVCLRDAFA
ncbi:hypothetical protein ABUV39_003540 [Vibrio cholerae]|nr:hypothetical protein [Vibrio cholerae]EJL6445849.1 hypothetical protein [Vibrio cholerae]MCU8238808.1 hypothetical protein [Vibrio vulnificus]QEO47559.1 hypothetical protein F0315_15095 [Vibrio cholerae]QEO47611.1 hypothetical protein F0315_20285 [Vibrio cholerae]